MSDDTRSDSGSFLSGFTIGVFAGAVGFFLFGTDRGRVMKDQLIHEWDAAKASMPDRGDGLTNLQSLRDIWGIIQTNIEKATEEGQAKFATRPRKRAVTKATKFKGT